MKTEKKERLLLIGAMASGKTYFIDKYINQKKYIDEEVVIFSERNITRDDIKEFIYDSLTEIVKLVVFDNCKFDLDANPHDVNPNINMIIADQLIYTRNEKIIKGRIFNFTKVCLFNCLHFETIEYFNRPDVEALEDFKYISFSPKSEEIKNERA